MVAPAGSGMRASGSRSHIFRSVVRHGPLPAVGVVATRCIVGRANGSILSNAGRDAVVEVGPAASSATVMNVVPPRWVGDWRPLLLAVPYRLDVAAVPNPIRRERGQGDSLANPEVSMCQPHCRYLPGLAFPTISPICMWSSLLLAATPVPSSAEVLVAKRRQHQTVGEA